VQPVLDAKCISCHGENRKTGLPDLRKGDLSRTPYGFHSSFCEFISRNLVQFYTKHYTGPKWATASRQIDAFVQAYSEPGKIGARGSRLYALLKGGHHGVRLTKEEMRRLTLFMDASGAYISHDYDAPAQLAGQVVEPLPVSAQTVRSDNCELAGPWRVDFPATDPYTPPASVTLSVLVPWKDAFNEYLKSHSARARYYSGKATYSTRFIIPAARFSDKAWLDLGRVETGAVVRVNGRLAEPAGKTKHSADVSGLLRPGVNEIEVEVVSSSFNRRLMDSMVRASDSLKSAEPHPAPCSQPIDNGLLGPVTLKLERPR
jgi:hypothetical protein